MEHSITSPWWGPADAARTSAEQTLWVEQTSDSWALPELCGWRGQVAGGASQKACILLNDLGKGSPSQGSAYMVLSG